MEATARVLVTSSRMPFAVDEIRKLGQLGYVVHAGDTFTSAPGSHSRHAAMHFAYPSPRQEPHAFVRAVAAWCEEHGLDTILPTFEETLYLAQLSDLLPDAIRLVAPDVATGLRLHNKASFIQLAREHDLPVPHTRVVYSKQKMREAMYELGRYLARPILSRGAIDLVTNCGPRAHQLPLEECRVSDSRPWLVQPFIDGDEICTYSIAYRGRLLAHVTYAHPRTLPNSGGITFTSIDSARTLRFARTIAEVCRYSGQFGLDLLDGPDGLVLAECNPRATSGVSLLPAEVFARSLFAPRPDDETFVVPAGSKRKITAGLILDILQNRRNLFADVNAMFRAGNDMYGRWGDMRPTVYAFLSCLQVRAFREQMPQDARGDWQDLVRAQFFDIAWNRT